MDANSRLKGFTIRLRSTEMKKVLGWARRNKIEYRKCPNPAFVELRMKFSWALYKFLKKNKDTTSIDYLAGSATTGPGEIYYDLKPL